MAKGLTVAFVSDRGIALSPVADILRDWTLEADLACFSQLSESGRGTAIDVELSAPRHAVEVERRLRALVEKHDTNVQFWRSKVGTVPRQRDQWLEKALGRIL